MSHDERAQAMTKDEIVSLLVTHEQLEQQRDDLKRQLDWLKQQLFGSKSERRFVDPDGRQLTLGENPDSNMSAEESATTVAAHSRRKHPPQEQPQADALRFDPSVPVEEVRLSHPALDEEHEVIGEKISYRLAQRPAAYVVLKYIRPVIKKKSDGALVCPSVPAAVLGKSLADVSLLASMLIDKFLYHLPLYRQHQRMQAAGIHLARSTLTGLIHRTGDLLEPIYLALLASILRSLVIAMDETPIKAGVQSQGKMKTGYFWPIYGDRAEIVFPFAPTRAASFVTETLHGFGGVLLTDGYVAYERYAEQVNSVVHAQCWSHTRRQFLQAEQIEPELTAKALELIGRMYATEARLRSKLIDESKSLELRAVECRPIVDEFFEWLKDTLQQRVLLPRNPFTEAAHYALSRERGLRVFLEHPGVPMDTNHLERQIRPIAVGRKNWMFCWTEVGARHVGIFQSLLASCRLQGVDPYSYLVDVLQRIETHPMSEVELLTPRLWKKNFADDPLRSAIDKRVVNASA